ncbi:MAG: hsp70 family protein [Deltaproteobacteria bacterium]|nr:hsp70 family protein [Deltaproteobacteria bacterium]
MAKIIGIDLGTTNTVVAELSNHEEKLDEIRAVPLAQHVGPSEISHAKELLPSTIYVPAAQEFPEGATTLPWGEGSPPFADATFVGAFAARQGAKVPGRLVQSSKSWLCHPGVDRRRDFLPWGADDDVKKMSPVDAATRLLAHVKSALAYEEIDLEENCEIVLTVPASFDEVARTLTVEAAQKAGLPKVHLVEEPQAAFYDFLHQHKADVSRALLGAKVVLVVDVGGGTCDLTLLSVKEGEDKNAPLIERVAVSDHLMLGGDNMDAALAHHIEKELTGAAGNLEAARWGSLLTSCRLAKEILTQEDAPNEMAVSLASRGRKLIGGAKSYALKKSEAQALLIDGFFPLSAADKIPTKRARTALAEFSLPFVDDPAVPHHICAFLRTHAGLCAEFGAEFRDGLPRPDAVLLNGGVFNAPAIQKRMMKVFANWYDDDVILLEHRSLDLSVARGAVVSVLAKQGKGVHIEGGSARSYFVGIHHDDEEKALCVAPKGMKEGSSETVERTFKMRVGEPVTFSVFHTTGDEKCKAGDVVKKENLQKQPPLETVIRLPKELPVRLKSTLTELGTLEISLEMTEEALLAFALSFSTRNDDDAVHKAPAESAAEKKLLVKAKEEIALFFGNKGQDVDPRQVKVLRRRLEKILGAREEWSLALNRGLCSQLLSGAKRRRRTIDHERTFLQLLGWTLRPGFGVTLDEWRAQETFSLFDQGLTHQKERPLWTTWWVLWRRVAGGLSAEQQEHIFQSVRYWAMPPKARQKEKAPAGKSPLATDEMMRALACFERLNMKTKVTLGDWMLEQLGKKANASWWPLGRLASRVPFAGLVSDVIPKEAATRFVEKLLELDWEQTEGAAFAAAQIARMTGDRIRDLDDELRKRVSQRLLTQGTPELWSRMVSEKIELAPAEEVRALGEALPVGLHLH